MNVRDAEWKARRVSVYSRIDGDVADRRVPARPTWIECLRACYENVSQARKMIALADDRWNRRDVIVSEAMRMLGPQLHGEKEFQIMEEALRSQINLDMLRAHGDLPHWQEYVAWYARKLDEDPSLTNQPITGGRFVDAVAAATLNNGGAA